MQGQHAHFPACEKQQNFLTFFELPSEGRWLQGEAP